MRLYLYEDVLFRKWLGYEGGFMLEADVLISGLINSVLTTVTQWSHERGEFNNKGFFY